MTSRNPNNNHGQFSAAQMAQDHNFAMGVRGTKQVNQNQLNLQGVKAKTTREQLYGFQKPRDQVVGLHKVGQGGKVTLREPTKDEMGAGLANMGTAAHPQDRKWEAQNWYSGTYNSSHGMNFGKAILNNEFFQYLQDKKCAEMLREYETWKLSLVNFESPAERQYWQRKFPELAQKKMDYHRGRAQIDALRNEIRSNGPQTANDFKFLYLDFMNLFETADLDTINFYVNNREFDYIWDGAIKDGRLTLNNEIQWDQGPAHEMVKSVPDSWKPQPEIAQ